MVIALSDLADLAQVNDLYMQWFKAHKRPARTIYQVAALPFAAKVKIMGTAVKALD